MVRVYVAGPYWAETPEGIAANVHKAAAEGAELLRLGYVPFVPHSMFHKWSAAPDLSEERILWACCAWLGQCTVMLLLPGWQQSKGTLQELRCARALGMPVFVTRADLLAALPAEGTGTRERGND